MRKGNDSQEEVHCLFHRDTDDLMKTVPSELDKYVIDNKPEVIGQNVDK